MKQTLLRRSLVRKSESILVYVSPWGNNIVNIVTPGGTYWQYCYPTYPTLRNFLCLQLKKKFWSSDLDSNSGPLAYEPRTLTTKPDWMLVNVDCFLCNNTNYILCIWVVHTTQWFILQKLIQKSVLHERIS